MSRHLDRLNQFRRKYVDGHYQRNLEQFKNISAAAIHCDDQRQASYEQTIGYVQESCQEQQTEADRLRTIIAQHKARLSEFE